MDEEDIALTILELDSEEKISEFSRWIGNRLNGEKLDVDQDWFALHTPANVRKLISLQLAVIETITDGMSMETEEDDDREREVDLVLQEIQKKSQTTDSPGEKSQPGD